MDRAAELRGGPEEPRLLHDKYSRLGKSLLASMILTMIADAEAELDALDGEQDTSDD